jgi:hypothetical protein
VSASALAVPAERSLEGSGGEGGSRLRLLGPCPDGCTWRGSSATPVSCVLVSLFGGEWPYRAHDSYLVDSASSHMLVSKIKPCMSKYKQLYGETANGSLNQLSFI